jgi:hypothetical protein
MHAVSDFIHTINRYVDDLGGVVLAYSDVALETPLGAIHNELPHIHFRVTAKFLVFTPTPGLHISTTIVTNRVLKQTHAFITTRL